MRRSLMLGALITAAILVPMADGSALAADAVLSGGAPRLQRDDSATSATSSGGAAGWLGIVTPDLAREAATGRGMLEVVVVLREPDEFNLARTGRPFAPGRLRFIQQTGDELTREWGLIGTRVTQRYSHLPFVLLEVPASLLTSLAADPRVLAIQPNRTVHATRVNGKAHLNVPAVAGIGLDGTGISVAVLDTGVDYTVPELAPGGTDLTAKTIKLWDAIDEDDDPMDMEGHGTSVAGIVAGSIDGVAPKAKIVAVRVLDATGSSKGDSIYRGLEKVIASVNAGNPFNIRVVNLSLGGLDPVSWPPNAGNCDDVAPAEKSAFDTLQAAGVVTIVAAGNDGCSIGVAYPSCASSAMAVGAVYNTRASHRGFGDTEHPLICAPDKITCSDIPAEIKAVACYSNSGDKLEVWGPSDNTVTPTKGSTDNTLTYDFRFNGTSAAAPYIAGVAALLAQAKPLASALAIREAMASTGTPITDPRNGITRNLVDASLAYDKIQLACTLPAAPQGAAVDKTQVCKDERFTLSWSAVTGATGGYTVEAASDVLFSDAQSFEVADTSLTLYDSTTTYAQPVYLRIRAKNGCGTGAWSATAVINYAGECRVRRHLVRTTLRTSRQATQVD